MTDKDLLVSVIMTTYNTKKEYLREAVNSILQQTYKNIELIILNDGSTEKITPQIADICDSRVRIVEHEENRGMPKCLNDAIQLSKGEFIARMDADDIADLTRFEKQVSAFLVNNEIQVLGSSIEYFGEKTGIRHPNISFAREEQQVDLLFGNLSIPHPTAMFRKSFLNGNKIKYNEEFIEGAEDYELWTQVTKYHKINCSLNPLLKYRVHAIQMTSANKNGIYNVSEKVRWKQLSQIGIVPTEEQKAIHRKFCSKAVLDMDDFASAAEWILLIVYQNNIYNYYDKKALKRKLYQRMTAMCKKYFMKTKDFRAVIYIIKYCTLDNIKNWMKRKLRLKEENRS